VLRYKKRKREKAMANTRRYELTDSEWEQVKDLLSPEQTGKKGKPRKDNRNMLNAMVWLARSGAPW
jgi:transposase